MPRRAVLLVVLCLLSGLQRAPAFAQVPQASPARPVSLPSFAIDVTAFDRAGRPVDDLAPGDLAVIVDGQPKRVLGLTHVSRGPGAEASAAARQRLGGAATTFAVEPSRVVLLVVDQALLHRVDERMAVQAATALLDRLGLNDRIGVVRLPADATTRIVLGAERPAVREALEAVTGRLGPTPGLDGVGAEDRARAMTVVPDRLSNADPDRAGGVPAREEAQTELPRPREEDVQKFRESLGAIAGVLNGLRAVPERKIVALFSAGLPPAAGSAATEVDTLAAAAGTARAVVHVFGLRSSRSVEEPAPDFSALEMLAKKSGGSFTMLDKDVRQTLDRTVAQFAACYVVTLDAAGFESDDRPHPVRVDSSRTDVILAAPSFVRARNDPLDPPLANRPASDAPVAPASGRKAAGAARDAELDLVLSRMTEYVQGYQRAFSGLVAEEDYVQQAGSRMTKLRSDFLLVKLETGDSWISFRDVFEVDGRQVRDRAERLQRLFLDQPMVDAVTQANKIQEESARLNVGPVRRNFNVPLFPLTYLLPDLRGRFQFALDKKMESGGASRWRIEFVERVRPTVIRNPRANTDVPSSGYFVVDPATGAVIESRLDATDHDIAAHLVVRYRHDDALGLWVPAEMTEVHNTRLGMEAFLDAKATYSNFRRFQVKTEEKITIPK